MSVLGSMLFDPAVTGDVIQVLRDGSSFFGDANRIVFDAMVELYDKYNALDVVQLTQLLTDRGLLERIGGMEHLLEIAESVPSAANAMRYARIVKDKSVQRRLIEAAGRSSSRPTTAATPSASASRRPRRRSTRSPPRPSSPMPSRCGTWSSR